MLFVAIIIVKVSVEPSMRTDDVQTSTSIFMKILDIIPGTAFGNLGNFVV